MHTKFERLLSKSLTTLEVMTYYLVVHTGTDATRSSSLYYRLVWPSGKASAARAEDPGFESRLRRDFFGVESYQ